MTQIYGAVGIFSKPEPLVVAAKNLRAAGFHDIEAFSPFFVEGLDQYLPPTSDKVALMTLIGGITGAVTAFGMQYYAYVIDFPLNVGGRPHNSWPAFIPITFELTVLFAAFFAVITMFASNRLPQPYHPIFNSREFDLGSGTKFCLCVKAKDPAFDTRRIFEVFRSSHADAVEEINL